MKIRGLLIAVSCVALSAVSAFAQYSIVSSVIGSGGGQMSNGTYSMNGTVGQAVVGITMGTSFAVDQGFWHSLSEQGGVQPIGASSGYDLEQNFPNPFNPSTVIRFGIPKSGMVKLTVTDITGKEVSSPLNEFKEAGTYEINFDASNLSSGIYFYKITVGDYSAAKKMNKLFYQ